MNSAPGTAIRCRAAGVSSLSRRPAPRFQFSIFLKTQERTSHTRLLPGASRSVSSISMRRHRRRGVRRGLGKVEGMEVAARVLGRKFFDLNELVDCHGGEMLARLRGWPPDVESYVVRAGAQTYILLDWIGAERTGLADGTVDGTRRRIAVP